MRDFYHGTSSFNSALIEKHGLLPYADKIYSDSTDSNSCSNISFGGVYITADRVKAEQSAKYACCVRGGKPVIFQLSVDLTSSDVWLDEDEVIRIIDDTVHTYSWADMSRSHKSLYRQILEQMILENDREEIFYRRAADILKGFDYSDYSDRLISSISPEIESEVATDMRESVNHLLLNYGLHILGIQCEVILKDLPEELENHFSTFVRSLNLFCSFFPEMKVMQDWDSYRIMSPIGFSPKNSKHWIVCYD